MANAKDASLATTDRKPWERMPKEPLKAYEAWKVFRDWPPMDRTIMAIGKKLGLGRQVYNWAKEYEWEDRVIAWEAELEAEERERRLTALDKMSVKHRKIVNGILKVAVKRLAKMNPDEMDPRTTLQFLLEAMNLERKIIGIPDIVAEARMISRHEEHTTHDINVDLAFDITPDIIAAFQQALAPGSDTNPLDIITVEEPVVRSGSTELSGSVDSESNG